MSSRMGGRFILFPDTKKELIIPNTILPDGKEAFLKQIFQADTTYSSYFCGLMGSAYDDDTTLADLLGSSEPTIATNGYARKELARDATDWPNIDEINGEWRARSKLMTWTPSGGAYDKPISRLFLASVGTGSTGKLFAVSGVFPNAITLEDGVALPVKYELWTL